MTQPGLLWQMIGRFFACIDAELAAHSVRCACYLTDLLKYQRYDEQTQQRMFMLTTLRDVGVQRMNLDALEHKVTATPGAGAIYSYLFCRWFSPLSELCRPLLYSCGTDARDPNLDENHRMGLKIALVTELDHLLLAAPEDDTVVARLLAAPPSAFAPQDVQGVIALLRSGALSRSKNTAELRSFYTGFTDKLQFSYRFTVALVRMLTFAIDLYSSETMYHSNSTAIVAQNLMQYSGGSEQQCHDIYLAGLLHDIGKVRVPYSILSKAGQLAPDEWRIMQQHVVWTREFLQGIFPDEIVLPAANHHERLNGSGYPQGLCAAQLSHADRVMALADVISALFTARAYKPGYSSSQVFEVLRDMQRHGLVDAGLVTIYWQNAEEINAWLLRENEIVASQYQMYEKERIDLLAQFDAKDGILV